VSRSYRVSVVLEFDDSAAAGEPRFVRLDPVGDPAFAGAGPLSAVVEEEAAFRLVGRLSGALEEGLAFEVAAAAPLSPPVPAGSLCQSPLEAYCGAEAVCRVSLLEPAAAERGDSLVVCSPCGERLWAEGVAGEPWECESGAAGDRCFGFAVVVAEAPGYGAAGAMNACRPCAAVLADQVAASAAAV
jgi:hypothetical protein